MINEILSASTSIKQLAELLKAATELRNFNEVTAKVAEVNIKLIEAHSAILVSYEKQSSLSARIRDLEEAVAQLRNWESESQRYQLMEIVRGTFAYSVKPGMQRGEPQMKMQVGIAGLTYNFSLKFHPTRGDFTYAPQNRFCQFDNLITPFLANW